MRSSAVIREATRNILSGTTRLGLLATALIIATGGLGAADLAAVRALEEKARTFQEVGASVLTLSAPGRIDGRACEALRGLSGVRAAGALRESTQQVRALALPAAPLQAKDVTVGFPAILTRQPSPPSGAVIVREAADQLGVGSGGSIPTTSGELRVGATFDYPDDGRRTGLGYAALLPTVDDGPFDECWVDAWPMITALPALLMTAVTPSTGARDEQSPALGQLNTRLGAEFDGPRQFANRVTAVAPVVAAALGLILGVVAIRLRRIQLAAALHSRMRRADLQAQMVLEVSAWCLPTLAVGVALAGIAVATGDPPDYGTHVILALRAPLAGVAGALVGTVIGVALTRERHLFRYFKDR